MTHVTFRHGMSNYRLTDRLVAAPGLTLPELSPAAAVTVLRGALGGSLPIVATRIRAAFPQIDGGRAGVPIIPAARLPDRIGALIRQRRLALLDLGPDVQMATSVQVTPADTLAANASMADKVGIVITGLADVPLSAIGAEGKAAFEQLRKALSETPALVTIMIVVFAGWVASHATGIGGLVIDAALLGTAVYAIGSQAFDWFARLAALVGDIAAAKTRADTRRCSEQLARLIVQIGVAAFVTLLLRAAGKRLNRAPAKPAEVLKTAPPRPAAPVAPAKRQTGTTVLGHNPDYQALANKGGDRYFDIPTDQWDRITKGMSKDEIFKKFNQPFIDRTIARGDNILLSNPITKVKPDSYFARELEYLFSKGYKPAADGMSLIKPGGP